MYVKQPLPWSGAVIWQTLTTDLFVSRIPVCSNHTELPFGLNNSCVVLVKDANCLQVRAHLKNNIERGKLRRQYYIVGIDLLLISFWYDITHCGSLKCSLKTVSGCS